MQRLCRFINVLSTIGSHMYIQPQGDSYVLIETGNRRLVGPQQVAMDAGYIALLRMLDFVTPDKVTPQSVALPQPKGASPVDYEKFFGCPVSFDAEAEIWTFASSDVEAPLSGAVPDVADATDRIAENCSGSWALKAPVIAKFLSRPARHWPRNTCRMPSTRRPKLRSWLGFPTKVISLVPSNDGPALARVNTKRPLKFPCTE
jgi:hypothetical protein